MTSDRRKRMDLQAESVLDGLRLMVATCDEHDLPGTHEVRVTADFARGLLRELEQLREALGAAVIALGMAAKVHGAVSFDTPEDDAVRDRAVETIQMALGYARGVLAGKEERGPLETIARAFVAAYEGNKVATLGNGAARRALESFRAALAGREPGD